VGGAADAGLRSLIGDPSPTGSSATIHTHSVDTGRLPDEDPFVLSVEKETSQRFASPLDALDGAA